MRKTCMIFALLLLLPLAFAAPETASIQANLLSQDPDPAYPGSLVEARFLVENVGKSDFENAKFEILPEYPFALENGDEAIRKPGTIYGGQVDENAYVFYYKLKVSPDASQGEYKVRLRYTNDEGENWKRFDPFKIRVATRSPIISINSVSSSPALVGLGKETILTVGLENIADSYIKNVRISLGLQDRTSDNQQIRVPFSPVGSSSEKVVKILEGGDKTTVSFKLASDVDARPGIYKFPATVSYEDDEGKEYSKTAVFSIQVGEPPHLLVTLENDDPFIIGRSDLLEVRLINKGLTDIKLLTVKADATEHYELLDSQTKYVGNIDSDDYEIAEFKIKCNSCANGKASIPLDISYLDENNKEYNVQKELEFRVWTVEEATEKGLIKQSNTTAYLLVGVLAVALIIVYRVLRKKRAKPKED